MPREFAHPWSAGAGSVTAAMFLGVVVMGGASCGGSASTLGSDGGSPKGASSGDSTGSASGGGASDGQSSSGGVGLPGANPGALPTEDAAPACIPMIGGGGGGSGVCGGTLEETCGGTDYQVSCACPQGTCACFGPSSTQVISFTGCPACPGSPGFAAPGALTTDQVFALCGFPH